MHYIYKDLTNMNNMKIFRKKQIEKGKAEISVFSTKKPDISGALANIAA